MTPLTQFTDPDPYPPAVVLKAPQEHPGKLSILLVDDNPGKLLSHEAVLNDLGENVVTAASGAEALHLMLRQDFAVILLDVNMPGMDGFETARLIRERPRYDQTPIIFVTAYNTTDMDRLHGYKLGAVDYLFLPIVPDVLKAKVRALVELSRQNQIIRKQAEQLAFHNQEQARQLEMIQNLNRSLTETNRELESFSYTISHDLRAPLRALKGFSEHLLELCNEKFNDEERDCAQRIQRAAVTLDRLTHDLLAYSRVARERIQLEPVPLPEVLDELVRMNPLLQAPHVDLVVSEELHTVLAQKSLLLHCLSNLVNNAIKFVQPGITPRIAFRSSADAGKARLHVQDNGIGIDPAHHKKIFGLFERVGDVRAREGTGIGLAIVARAVERMNGACGVHSRPGAGSSFWIELPLAAAESVSRGNAPDLSHPHLHTQQI